MKKIEVYGNTRANSMIILMCRGYVSFVESTTGIHEEICSSDY